MVGTLRKRKRCSSTSKLQPRNTLSKWRLNAVLITARSTASPTCPPRNSTRCALHAKPRRDMNTAEMKRNREGKAGMPKRFAALVRVSTERQKDKGESLDTQTKQL